jgi:hypothetical protein
MFQNLGFLRPFEAAWLRCIHRPFLSQRPRRTVFLGDLMVRSHSTIDVHSRDLVRMAGGLVPVPLHLAMTSFLLHLTPSATDMIFCYRAWNQCWQSTEYGFLEVQWYSRPDYTLFKILASCNMLYGTYQGMVSGLAKTALTIDLSILARSPSSLVNPDFFDALSRFACSLRVISTLVGEAIVKSREELCQNCRELCLHG